MPRPTHALLLALLAAACGGSDAPGDRAAAGAPAAASRSEDDLDACTLVTAEEIQAAAGWAPDTAIAKTHGTTKTCAIHGADALKQSIVLIVARPAPKVSSSAELAERRTRDAARSPEMKMKYAAVEGLEAPAVSTEVEGAERLTLEMIVGNRSLTVSAPEFEMAKALGAKAAARLR